MWRSKNPEMVGTSRSQELLRRDLISATMALRSPRNHHNRARPPMPMVKIAALQGLLRPCQNPNSTRAWWFGWNKHIVKHNIMFRNQIWTLGPKVTQSGCSAKNGHLRRQPHTQIKQLRAFLFYITPIVEEMLSYKVSCKLALYPVKRRLRPNSR